MPILIKLASSILALALVGMVSSRTHKNLVKKNGRTQVFAIRNVSSGRNLRPRNADLSNGTRVILHPSHNWECMTWR